MSFGTARNKQTNRSGKSDSSERKFIEPSTSPWSSPDVLATKKSENIRFYEDYRRLIDVTKKFVFDNPNN